MAGGIEKMISVLANEMSNRGHDISILTWDKESAVNFYKLNNKVKWIKLDLGCFSQKPSLKLRFNRYVKTRTIINNIKPDVVIAFQPGVHINTRIPMFFSKIPIIVAERESPWRYKFIQAGKWRIIFFYPSCLQIRF